MKIQVAYKDGSFGEIPGVNYHPAHKRYINQFDTTDEPGGLWITVEKLVAHIERVNEYRRANGIKERVFSTPTSCVDLIDFASAPLEVYVSTEDGSPWKHNGMLIKTIPYGGDDSFWK